MNKIIPSFDPEADEGPVPSPCISVCKIDDKNKLCVACYRSLDEIAVWSQAHDYIKREVWKKIHLRKAQLNVT